MATTIVMPQLSPTMEEGVLLKLLVKEGDTVKLGAPVAVLGEAGESADVQAAPAAHVAVETTQKIEKPAAKPVEAPAVEPARVKSSPLARKIAAERKIDLAAVEGSGPGGRVIQRDIEKARPAAAAQKPAAPSTALSPMRKTIARRLVEAKTTVPHFYVTMDARGDAIAEFHAQLKEAGEIKVSINDLLIKALATALARVPAANVSWSDAGLIQHDGAHISVAVSVEDGLVTPVVRDAEKKSIGAIAKEARDLIERARARRLRPGEFTGGSFGLSNLGMHGVREFAAIINPPESGILAVGALEKRAVVDGEAIVARRMMSLTLSADHRVVDGALAARLLGEIVRVIERPMLMAL